MRQRGGHPRALFLFDECTWHHAFHCTRSYTNPCLTNIGIGIAYCSPWCNRLHISIIITFPVQLHICITTCRARPPYPINPMHSCSRISMTNKRRRRRRRLDDGMRVAYGHSVALPGAAAASSASPPSFFPLDARCPRLEDSTYLLFLVVVGIRLVYYSTPTKSQSKNQLCSPCLCSRIFNSPTIRLYSFFIPPLYSIRPSPFELFSDDGRKGRGRSDGDWEGCGSFLVLCACTTESIVFTMERHNSLLWVRKVNLISQRLSGKPLRNKIQLADMIQRVSSVHQSPGESDMRRTHGYI